MTRLTIRHQDGNTVTGTPEEVLNHGHLMPGWSWIPTPTERKPMAPQGFVELEGRYFRIDSIDAVSEPRGDGRAVLLLRSGPWSVASMTMAQVLDAIEMAR